MLAWKSAYKKVRRERHFMSKNELRSSGERRRRVLRMARVNCNQFCEWHGWTATDFEMNTRMHASRTFYCHEPHFDALRCFADLLSYDNKRCAQIALRRIGILSLTRPAAGEESCKAGFLSAHKVALPPYLFASRFSCEHEICLQKVRVNCNVQC